MNVNNVIQQLEQEKARLEGAIVALRKFATSSNGAARLATPRRHRLQVRRRGRLSAAGRRRIAQTQRARWAKQRQKKA